MRIGVISDTHGSMSLTRPAIQVLVDAGVERVIHCGDIGSRQIVELFDRWETHFVFGNVDQDEFVLRSTMEPAGHVCHGRFGDVTWANRRIAILHGDDYQRLREATHSGDFDLICSGHTHERSLEVEGRTKLLNPGAIYRTSDPSVAIVDLVTLEIVHLSVPRK